MREGGRGSEEDPTFDPLSHSWSAFEPNFNAAHRNTKRQSTTELILTRDVNKV